MKYGIPQLPIDPDSDFYNTPYDFIDDITVVYKDWDRDFEEWEKAIDSDHDFYTSYLESLT